MELAAAAEARDTPHSKAAEPLPPHAQALEDYRSEIMAFYGPLDDDSVLDECNGMTVDGKYRYHVRTNEQVNSADYCDWRDRAHGLLAPTLPQPQQL